MTLLHPVDALIQAGVRKRRAHQLVAALDRVGYKIVATSETLQRATECPHCGSCPPPHHGFCGADNVHGEHPLENGQMCCGRTTL